MSDNTIDPEGFFKMVAEAKAGEYAKSLTPLYEQRWEIWKSLSREQFDIYVNKNTDYGDSFVQGIKLIGPISLVTRCFDKVMRMITLSMNPAMVKSESFEDSVRDMINYGMMYLMHGREEDDSSHRR